MNSTASRDLIRWLREQGHGPLIDQLTNHSETCLFENGNVCVSRTARGMGRKPESVRYELGKMREQMREQGWV